MAEIRPKTCEQGRERRDQLENWPAVAAWRQLTRAGAQAAERSYAERAALASESDARERVEEHSRHIHQQVRGSRTPLAPLPSVPDVCRDGAAENGCGSQRKYKQSLDTLVEERQSGRRHGVDEMRQAEQRRVALAVRRHRPHFLPAFLSCVCDESEPATGAWAGDPRERGA